ncbi:DUF6414 family protein [Kallipyga massiliensis]|uniref:DUF6414 family protein n=1 Tax=Kallipyga massiliensis TaxID=1472764 RepID=UPI0004B427CB|nr:DUF6414 family protein [Kallipyga massiliensis]
MSEGKPQTRLCKIIYFDDDSVTDYLQLISGGSLELTTELLNSTSKSGEGKVEGTASIGIGGVLKAFLGWNVDANVSTSAKGSFSGEKMVRNIIKNTILTDFVNSLDENESTVYVSKLPKGTVKKFKDYKIAVEKDTLSYFVMVSPYLNMLQSGSVIASGELNISLDKLDNALRNAKGYYEFIGSKGNSQVVLRFNINSFKNNYMISDLLKMNLSIFAIKVGDTTLEMLDINNELNLDLPKLTVDNPTYQENNNESDEKKNPQKKLPVFDVLLAGVESDG